MSAYSIKQLIEDDWQALRAIRLEALQTEPRFFGSNYPKELAYDEEKWRSWLKGTESAFFGLYESNDLIGLTGIRRQDENPDTAVLIASYIRKEHRGKNLSGLLYGARIDWAKENDLEKIIVSHRKSNEASKGANQKFGFKQTGVKMADWPDGTQEEQVYYELILKSSNVIQPKLEPKIS